jgi:hypothetical protein
MNTATPDAEPKRPGQGQPKNGAPANGRKSIADVGRTIPADFLAVANDSVPYDLRVEAIERSGLPDVLIDTAESPSPGHIEEGSALRIELDTLLEGAAKRIVDQTASAEPPSD